MLDKVIGAILGMGFCYIVYRALEAAVLLVRS